MSVKSRSSLGALDFVSLLLSSHRWMALPATSLDFILCDGFRHLSMPSARHLTFFKVSLPVTAMPITAVGKDEISRAQRRAGG